MWRNWSHAWLAKSVSFVACSRQGEASSRVKANKASERTRAGASRVPQRCSCMQRIGQTNSAHKVCLSGLKDTHGLATWKKGPLARQGGASCTHARGGDTMPMYTAAPHVFCSNTRFTSVNMLYICYVRE